MGVLLANHRIHTDVIVRCVEWLERGMTEALQNLKTQHDSWQRFHQTSVGRHVSRRAWMRHGAMLELLSMRDS